MTLRNKCKVKLLKRILLFKLEIIGVFLLLCLSCGNKQSKDVSSNSSEKVEKFEKTIN